MLIRVFLTIAMIGASSATATPQQPPAKDQKSPAKSNLMPVEKAKPILLGYIKDTLHGADPKIETISDPMEADKITAMSGKNTAAYYVDYSIYSDTMGKRLTRKKIMWIVPRGFNGKPIVMGERDRDDFAKSVDKDWLRKHPLPK